MYYSEEFHLARLVLLVEYKLKTEFLKNNLKHEHVKKQKPEEKSWEDTILNYSAFQKIFLAVINKALELAFNSQYELCYKPHF